MPTFNSDGNGQTALFTLVARMSLLPLRMSRLIIQIEDIQIGLSLISLNLMNFVSMPEARKPEIIVSHVIVQELSNPVSPRVSICRVGQRNEVNMRKILTSAMVQDLITISTKINYSAQSALSDLKCSRN